MAGVDPDRACRATRPTTISSALLERAIEERTKAGAVDYATMLATATEELRDESRSLLADKTVLLLDVAIGSKAEAAFVQAVIAAAAIGRSSRFPSGDAAHPRAPRHRCTGRTRAHRTHRRTAAAAAAICSPTMRRPPASNDESVVLFSAPGEGREAVEIARRLLQEAERGVPFDQMAVLLRAPQTYLGVLEHALDRAGIPAWFHRGTRRPDPAGRALLALLACADEELSARRFAEYVSLGQVPLNEAGNADSGRRRPTTSSKRSCRSTSAPRTCSPKTKRRRADRSRRIRSRSRRHAARAVAMGGSDRRSRGDRQARSLAAPPQGPRARIRSPRSRSELRRSGSVARARADARSRTAARPAVVCRTDPRGDGRLAGVAVVGRLAERARAAGAARDRQTRARAAHAARAGAAVGDRPGAACAKSATC